MCGALHYHRRHHHSPESALRSRAEPVFIYCRAARKRLLYSRVYAFGLVIIVLNRPGFRGLIPNVNGGGGKKNKINVPIIYFFIIATVSLFVFWFTLLCYIIYSVG